MNFFDKRTGGKRARVFLEVDLGTYGKYFLRKLVNVSSSGAFIIDPNPHPTGTEVKLRFKLPDDKKPIEALGKVAWTYKQPNSTAEPNASGMGVEFTEISDKDKERIADFVARSTQN